MTKIQRSNVIESKNVIGVTMRDQNGVEMLQTGAQGLLTKVSRGVNNNCLPGVFNKHRNAQALVTWIVRRARFTVARNGRNPGGCAGAKESQLHSKLRKAIFHLSFLS